MDDRSIPCAVMTHYTDLAEQAGHIDADVIVVPGDWASNGTRDNRCIRAVVRLVTAPSFIDYFSATYHHCPSRCHNCDNFLIPLYIMPSYGVTARRENKANPLRGLVVTDDVARAIYRPFDLLDGCSHLADARLDSNMGSIAQTNNPKQGGW